MRRWGLGLVLLFAVVLTLVGVARGAGMLRGRAQVVGLVLPDDPALPHCPAPCWNGIHTNRNSHAATVAAIMALPNAEQDGLLDWRFGVEGHSVLVRLDRGRDIVLRPQSGVRLGDVLAVLGEPAAQVRGMAVDRTHYRNISYVSVYYPVWGVVVSAIVIVENHERVSPQSLVVQIVYPAGVYPPLDYEAPWAGFSRRAVAQHARMAPFLVLD